jgi:hypothetical protein
MSGKRPRFEVKGFQESMADVMEGRIAIAPEKRPRSIADMEYVDFTPAQSSEAPSRVANRTRSVLQRGKTSKGTGTGTKTLLSDAMRPAGRARARARLPALPMPIPLNRAPMIPLPKAPRRDWSSIAKRHESKLKKRREIDSRLNGECIRKHHLRDVSIKKLESKVIMAEARAKGLRVKRSGKIVYPSAKRPKGVTPPQLAAFQFKRGRQGKIAKGQRIWEDVPRASKAKPSSKKSKAKGKK